MTPPEPSDIYPTQGRVHARDRARVLGQTGCVVWLTGLSGSGKSTVAQRLEELLIERGHAAYVLDGDNLRHGLNRDLGFSPEDRSENIRRVAAVAALFAESGLITVAAFISPYRDDRAAAREAVGPQRFLEVFVDAPTEVCAKRDPKGLYARAKEGQVAAFTGVTAPYEPPLDPALVVKTDQGPVEDSTNAILALLEARGFLSPIAG